jgi:hypothetical protein
MKCIAAIVSGMVAAASAAVFVALVTVAPAAAENPSELGADLADDSVYIAPRRIDEVDAAPVTQVLERVRADGLTVYVLWPDEPLPNTGAFARRVQELYEVDVVLVFGPEGQLGSHVSDDLEGDTIRALNAARQADGPAEIVDAYVAGLLEEPERPRPAIVNTLVRWIAILVGALVAAAVGEQMIRQYKRSRQRRELEQLRVD